MSPSLDIPQNGLTLESNPPSDKSATNITPAIGLTLSDGMIEDMIKCFQNGKSIELSLGSSPNLIYGNKSHRLSVYHDPFQYEVFQTANPHDTNSEMSNSRTLDEVILANKKLSGPGAQPRYQNGKYKGEQETDQKECKCPEVEDPRRLQIRRSFWIRGLEAIRPSQCHNRIAGPKDDLKQAMSKVGDLNTSTGKWELRKHYYKELDVFNFNYESDAERQRAIDNAVKAFDKMRLGYQSLSGKSSCLNQNEALENPLASYKLKSPMALLRKPKSNGSKNRDSGDEEDVFGDKAISKVKGEATARSASGPSTSKTKKLSEKEAQAKRLLSKNPAKTAATTSKPKPAKKKAEKPKPSMAKPLSSQFVSESDDEEIPVKKAQVAKAPIKKASTKRLRDEEVDSSDSSLPLSKKTKKDSNPSHRVSDASQSSRPSSTSTTSSSNSFKGKANSPQKSSPLASSPPTNASDFENTSGGDRSSASASPANHRTSSNTRNNRSPIHKRHQKSSSVASSVSSTGSSRHLRPGVLDLAAHYKQFYPVYLRLHNELARSKVKNPSQEEDLLAMHERLSDLKRQILDGIIEE
ncbi:hypothetical protein DID88_008897 [Monilinia fructigena]|uniref:Uncharacterized protein n=1 Tax=Monilinia fructigena TaxID=38457 RepID=A0A395J6V9_9HELO|nr:hypothetical protein DID88_008897 [Monilinia fructigena]